MDSHILLALVHILIVAPALLYVAIRRAATPGWAYSAMLFVGLFIIVYHGYKGFIRIVKKSPYAWVNLFHALLIGPLITYIGFQGREAPRASYELLAMAGFAAIGYHLYSLIKLLQIHEQSAATR